MPESKDPRPGSLINVVTDVFKDEILGVYHKSLGMLSSLTKDDFERFKTVPMVKHIDKPSNILPPCEKVISPSFSMGTTLKPAQILMNKQDFDDVLQWGMEQGIVVDPELKKARDKAKEIIAKSEDDGQVADALEVLIVTSAAEEHRDVTFGDLASVTKIFEDNSIKDIQYYEDAAIMAAFEAGAISTSTVLAKYGLSLDEENEAMKKETKP